MTKLFLTISASALMAAGASAGTLVVAGDSTIAFRFNSGVTSGAPALAGNVTFAQTLMAAGGGNVVRIFGGPGSPDYTGQLVAGFTGIGASVSAFTGTIDSAALSGANLFVAFFPGRSFTAPEAGALRDFLSAGGTVFLAGEATTNPFGNPLGAAQNARLNGLLELMGSSLRLDVGSFDIGDQFATLGADRIVGDPLTDGIRSFGYGLTTTVSGGRALFLTNDFRPFVAAESHAAAIPEPATWAMMILGFGLVGRSLRRQRRQRQQGAATA